VLLEGMATGCVPLATDLPGVRDLVFGAGVLVAPRRVTALRDALRHLAAHPEEVQRLSAAAAQRSTEFAWTDVGLQYQRVLYQALGRP